MDDVEFLDEDALWQKAILLAERYDFVLGDLYEDKRI